MNEARGKQKRTSDRSPSPAKRLIAIGLCIAGVATPAPAAAADVRKAEVDLHLKNHTLENLSEEGILSRPVAPARSTRAGTRFPLDRGHLKTGRHRHGKVHGLGGLMFARDDGRTVVLDSPSIVVRKHTAAIDMLVQGIPVRVAHLPHYNVARQGRRVEIKGVALFSQSGAELMTETFGSPYPHPDTQLGTLILDMRLRAPADR
jgi:hypothetical protein